MQDAPYPQFAGIPTYLRAPMRAIQDVSPGTIAVIGVPTDFTCGSRAGTRHGPHSIREASLFYSYYMDSSPDSAMMDLVTGTITHYRGAAGKLVDVGDTHIFPTDVQRTSEAIRSAVRELVERGAFPVILGGDHYITYPAFHGFSDAVAVRKEGAKIGYIQFDAHTDLADNNPIWGKYYHGSNARRVAELPTVDAKNMVWIGTSTFIRPEQWEFVRDHDAHLFTINDVQRRGMREVVDEAWEHASRGCDTVYLTIDIDCIDCASAPGTGSTNFDGLRPRDLLEAMDLLSSRNIGAIDLVEVAPNLDPAEVTQRLAAFALLTFLRHRFAVPAQ